MQRQQSGFESFDSRHEDRDRCQRKRRNYVVLVYLAEEAEEAEQGMIWKNDKLTIQWPEKFMELFLNSFLIINFLQYNLLRLIMTS